MNPEGAYVVQFLDANNQSREMAVSAEDAPRILKAFDQNAFDLERYAQAPPEFPTPDSILVEIDGPKAGVSLCSRCGHGVSSHSTHCNVPGCACPYSSSEAYAS